MTTAIENKQVSASPLEAEEVVTRRQQLMIKESLTQAFKELNEGKSRPVEELFSESFDGKKTQPKEITIK